MIYEFGVLGTIGRILVIIGITFGFVFILAPHDSTVYASNFPEFICELLLIPFLNVFAVCSLAGTICLIFSVFLS